MNHTTSLSRVARASRRLLTALAVVTLLGGVATATFDESVALAQKARPPVASAPPAARPPAAGRAPLTGKLNLNTASGAELERLPGVGPTKAERILAFRAKHGPFKRIVDLRRVKGFGKKTVDRLAPYLTLTEKTTLAGG